MKQKLISTTLAITLIMCVTFPCFATTEEENVYVWSNGVTNNTSSNTNINNTTENTTQTSKETLSEEIEDTASEVTDENTLNLESESAILIEQTTGQVLYDHNSHEQLRPASVTKIMSILLIMEQIEKGALSYDDKIPCSETASAMGGSQIWLDTKETLTVEEMLKAICVVSANDYNVQK